MKLFIQKKNETSNLINETEISNIEEILAKLNEEFTKDLQMISQEEEEFETDEEDNEIEISDLAISETKEVYKIELFLPGFQKEDFMLEISEDGILSVNVETDDESYEKDRIDQYSEFANYNFSRSFQMPEDANIDEIEAHYENDILKLLISKTTNNEVESFNEI
jgi:HSP20 family protein